MSEVTLIVRKPPVKETADHGVLYKLWPKSLIYCTDFGLAPIKWNTITDEELKARESELEEKIKLTKDVAPFNGASLIAPLLTVYRLRFKTVEYHMEKVIAHTMRFFPTDIVYLDLGVHVNIERERKVFSAFRKFNPSIKLGVIAPYEEYCKMDSEFMKIIGGNIIPCPFLEPGMPIEPQIDNLLKLYPPFIQAFCGLLAKSDVPTFAKYIKESKLSKFVFWSPIALQDLNVEELSQKPVQEVQIVPMTAMFTSVIRRRPSMDSPIFEDKNVVAGQTVKIRALPSKSQTTFGAIDLDEGGTGYVVLKHNGHSKFQEKTGDTHEQSVSK